MVNTNLYKIIVVLKNSKLKTVGQIATAADCKYKSASSILSLMYRAEIVFKTKDGITANYFLAAEFAATPVATVYKIAKKKMFPTIKEKKKKEPTPKEIVIQEFEELRKSYKNMLDSFTRQLVDLQDRILQLEQTEKMRTNHYTFDHNVHIKIGG